MLRQLEGTQTVILPRTAGQRAALAGLPGLIVPDGAVDGQSLVAYADLVVSAGGTMNREAVALSTPAYTLFEGRLGAVDAQLIAEGRLRRLEDPRALEVVKRPPAARKESIRRDPAVLRALLLAPVRGRV